jgi:hypothetical protein
LFGGLLLKRQAIFLLPYVGYAQAALQLSPACASIIKLSTMHAGQQAIIVNVNPGCDKFRYSAAGLAGQQDKLHRSGSGIHRQSRDKLHSQRKNSLLICVEQFS